MFMSFSRTYSDTPVTSLPDTSDGITLQQWMTAFTLFTGGSLQKRPQPPINLFSALGWAVHTFCVALTQSTCLYLTLKVPLSGLDPIFHVAMDISLLLFSHTTATLICLARWPCCLPRNPFASCPHGDDFHPPSHISCLDHTVSAHQLGQCLPILVEDQLWWASAFISSSANHWFRWSIMKPMWEQPFLWPKKKKSTKEDTISCTGAVFGMHIAYQLSQSINFRNDNAREGTGLFYFIVKRI